MDTRVLMALVFAAGASVGWLAKTWEAPVQTYLSSVTSVGAESTDTHDSGSILNGDLTVSSASGTYQQNEKPLFEEKSDGALVSDSFTSLLVERRYFEAVTLYQEQMRQDVLGSSRLRGVLLTHLQKLLEERQNSDFSELIENYLSIYYDDIDVLLLLAEFNNVNGSYLEVVDVFLLAKTYAYKDVDQRKVDTQFDYFVEQVDNLHAKQEDWWSLINLFSHIESSGLMKPIVQYRQAIARLRIGDEETAIIQLEQLVGDSVVGESAEIALNSVVNNTEQSLIEAPSVSAKPAWESADSIALEKYGNQYLVNMTNNQQGSVKLLIDTGASMTVVSIASFNSLNVNGDATIKERRVFQTAGGVVMGTVYSMPELRLGTYLFRDTKIAVIDFNADRNIDGLLGMNILGQFRFQIDQVNSRLLLSKE